MSFRRIRILLLLGVLALTLGLTSLERYLVRAWRAPLDVVVYPVNGDGSEASAEYIRALRPENFAAIDAFLEREARRYGVKLSPAMTLTLEPEIHEAPPAPPHDRSVVQTILWSLKLRWWVYRHSGQVLPQLGKIRLYVLFHEAHEGRMLDHSLGLQKGLVGVVHVFASDSMASRNQVVIAHELLHTLGATDKYDPATNQPLFPDGYAEPAREPLHPQNEAEIMAGRIPLADDRAVMPRSLDQSVIGAATAHEINFGGGFASQYSH